MPSTSAIIILSWSITALNPDGTPNTFLPSIPLGSVPPDPTADLVDFMAMGNRVELKLTCQLNGNYIDGTAIEVQGSTFRYNPALFLEYLGIYNPPGIFPTSGYAIQIPGSYDPSMSAQYVMPLIGQGGNLNSNINGDVIIDVTGTIDFEITHTFYLTSDIEQYPAGLPISNWFRFSKNSIYNEQERDNTRESVFNSLKGLNVYLSIAKGRNSGNAEYLSIPFRASFDGSDSMGIVSAITCEFKIERLLVPGVEETDLSPFEDNLVKITLQDASAFISKNESEVMFVCRDLSQNVSTFVIDLQLSQAKLITSGGSARLDGPMYEPVTWSQSAGVTEITFVVVGPLLAKSSKYQIHFRAAINNSPSDNVMIHYMSDVYNATGSPIEVPFDMTSEFWTRNAKHAESFTVIPAERVTSVFMMNATDYNNNVIAPWQNFIGDIQSVSIQVLNASMEVLLTYEIAKSDSGIFTDTDFIGVYITSDPSADTEYFFYLKAFRIPFENNQELPDWTNQSFIFRWSAIFQDQKSLEFSGEYFQDSELIVTNFDNENPSPYVSDIRFLDPTTMEVISDWHDLTTVRVVASVENIGVNTFVQVLVDRFPLGVTLFNDMALEENDPSTHTLPPYVIIDQLLSDLVSELPSQPIDGFISFLVDISEISGDEKANIYITVYDA
jgi:hypothetical protein